VTSWACVARRSHATDPPERWKEPGGFPGHRPCNATRRQGRGRHSVRRRVRGQCGERGRALGSLIPYAPRARRTGDRDDPDGRAGCADGVAGLRASRLGAPPSGTPANNTRGRDHTRRKSRRVDYSIDRFSGEAARPRRRSGNALRLDRASNRGTRKGRLARSVGASRWSPRARRAKLQPSFHIRGKPDSLQQSGAFEGALGGSCSRALV
jgi:hypothetical protein